MLMVVFAPTLLAQEMDQIIPNWKKGDVRLVHTETTNQIIMMGEELTNTTAVSDYRIEVTDVGEYYTLKFNQLANDMDMDMNLDADQETLDSAMNIIMQLVQGVQDAVSKMEYRLLVDKQTGLATEVLDQDKMMADFEVAVMGMVDDIEEMTGEKTTNKDSLNTMMKMMMMGMKPQIMETTLNSFNYLTQSYSYTFPANGKMRQEMLIENVNALGDLGDVELPAMMDIETVNGPGNRVKVIMDSDYDKAALIAAIQQSRGSSKQINEEDMQIMEREIAEFDRSTTWIVKHTSDVEVEMPQIKVKEHTVVTYSLPSR